MAGVAQIPRSRGSLCGLLLILLGLWGGLAPFVGPYLHFGFTPDNAFHYTTGRLYLSVAPGAAALVGGLFVLMTRSRAVGIVSGLLAALGGAWLIAGYATVVDVLKNLTISPGLPMDSTGGTALFSTTRTYAEQLSFFAGLGILILFFAALAMGRFSMISAKDADGSAGYGSYQGAGQDQFPDDHEEAPAPQAQFPSATGQFPAQQQHPASAAPFPPAQQYPPAQDDFPTSAS
jgi:hypothetical protein